MYAEIPTRLNDFIQKHIQEHPQIIIGMVSMVSIKGKMQWTEDIWIKLINLYVDYIMAVMWSGTIIACAVRAVVDLVVRSRYLRQDK